MKILSIETIGKRGSVAALVGNGQDAQLLAESTLTEEARSAQSLVPALHRICEQVSWKPAEVELVAVAVGPGSFTGLRIGVTTAKSFAYATNAKIVGVDSLDVLAMQVGNSGNQGDQSTRQTLWAVLDAQRNQLFAAKYEWNESCFERSAETVIINRKTWLEQLQPGDMVVGPVLTQLADELPTGITIVPDQLWLPNAVTVGLAGWKKFQQHGPCDLWQMVPTYLRLSAAEEKIRNEAKK